MLLLYVTYAHDTLAFKGIIYLLIKYDTEQLAQ